MDFPWKCNLTSAALTIPCGQEARQMSTAEIVRELGEELANPELPVSAEVAIAHALARLVELEPGNTELDDWRECIEATHAAATQP